MPEPLRVVHYVNQFFGGIGGEEAANVDASVADGTVGSGRALQQALGPQGTVVHTLICGDNYANDRRDEAMTALETHLRALQPDVLMAGPAFGSGRYGLACAQVCQLAQEIGIPALTGMHPDNPGVASSWPNVLMAPTGETSADMQTALAAMTRLAVKLGRGEVLGAAEHEGYLPRGIRRMIGSVPGMSGRSICCCRSCGATRSSPRCRSTRPNAWRQRCRLPTSPAPPLPW